MAGYLDAKELSNLAAVGAKIILKTEELDGNFDKNPDGCFRFLLFKYLFNEYFIQPLVDSHPSFLPVAENLRQSVSGGNAHPDDICVEVFYKSIDLYETETYKYDVNFNIMLAAILNNCFTPEIRQEYKGLFLPMIEQCDSVTGVIPIILLASALWGADYENFRELTTSKYSELEATGFGKGETSQGEENENEQDPLLKQARENIDHFDEKLNYIRDVNARFERDIDSLDSQTDIGKKYVQYYMEIEKYYVAPLDRMKFIGFCADAQPETLLKKGGFVPFDYYTGQIEKCIQEFDSPEKRKRFLWWLAKRASSVAGWEMLQAIADGDYDMPSYGWERICKYIYNKSDEWGWDRYMEDAELWDYAKRMEKKTQTQAQATSQTQSAPQNTSTSQKSSYTTTTNEKSGGCYIATAVYGSYDCPEVWTLRRFRDFSLAESWYGRAFIKLYYAISPTLVKWFGESAWFNRLCRRPLDKLVARLRNEGYEDTPYHDN